MNGIPTTRMPRKQKRKKEDNITMRGIKVRNSPILVCPECLRRYIQTEDKQKKCLFCLREIRDFTEYSETILDF